MIWTIPTTTIVAFSGSSWKNVFYSMLLSFVYMYLDDCIFLINISLSDLVVFGIKKMDYGGVSFTVEYVDFHLDIYEMLWINIRKITHPLSETRAFCCSICLQQKTWHYHFVDLASSLPSIFTYIYCKSALRMATSIRNLLYVKTRNFMFCLLDWIL